MASKKRAAQRGATRRPEKTARREWHVPAWIRSIHWSWVVAPVLLVGLFLGGREMVDRWTIRDVRVTGDLTVWNAADIISQVGWIKGQGFFSADLQGVYENVLSMPLIKEVRVKKRWPGYVEITVREDIPMAVWNSNKLIGISGDLMAIPAHLNVDKLTLIQGDIEYMDKAVKDYRLIQQALAPVQVNVRTLSLTETGSVELDLSNNWRVALGRKNIEARARRLLKVMKRLPADQVAEVDLRYGKGAAIRWQPQQEKG